MMPSMPSGRTHDAINLVSFGAIAAGYAYARSQGLTTDSHPLFTTQAFTLFSICFLAGTFLVTPDLDLAEGNVQAKRNWGLLGLLWVPYGKMFKHRGLSHSWFLGPLTRLVYMVVVALALLNLAQLLAPYFGYAFSIRTEFGENWRELLLGALAGYYLSQWTHLLADAFVSDFARPVRRRRR
jgi:uncharacterized metal-binding protein